ncbi:MAG: ThuA domain-containing protein [Verrucomicrobiota bacterium]
MKKLLLTLALLAVTLASATAAAPIKVLIVDGQNNHDWKGTTPWLKKLLEDTGKFTVETATTPPAKGDMTQFKPDFSKYDVVVSNYNGDPWSDATKAAFETFMKNGGGFVAVHAADNSFPEWKAYNEMIGVGGWGGRTEKSGPYVNYWEGKIIKDLAPGRGGSHGAQHEFVVETRDADHPIMKGIPAKWLHAKDELYDRLRGPAENLTVLATAFADPQKGGSGKHEPMLMVLNWNKGRVFHTTLGHARPEGKIAMECVGFIVTFQRGTEWAATGKVTIPVGRDFPTADKVSLRPDVK